MIADADRRMTFAYVMNKMAMTAIVEPTTAALVERVYDIMNRQATPHTAAFGPKAGGPLRDG